MRTNPNNGKFSAIPLASKGNSPQDIRAYWTPERKKAAVPAPLGVNKEQPQANTPPATDPRQADESIMPFLAAGKLFYTMDGTDFVASGNIFMQNRLLLTAAHCVQNKITGNLGENFVFERCFTGEESAEDLTFQTIALREEWVATKDVKFDYALVVLNEMSNVPTPLRYSTEEIQGKTITSMGYPVALFEGEQMVFVKGPATAQGNHWVMQGSQMGPGSSGGAWVLEDGVTAVGVNAYVAFSEKGEILLSGSPRFDADFDSLYQYALTLLGGER